jgi:hypothetical protein
MEQQGYANPEKVDGKQAIEDLWETYSNKEIGGMNLTALRILVLTIHNSFQPWMIIKKEDSESFHYEGKDDFVKSHSKFGHLYRNRGQNKYHRGRTNMKDQQNVLDEEVFTNFHPNKKSMLMEQSRRAKQQLR